MRWRILGQKYSLGEDVSVIEKDFHNAIYDLENTGSRKLDI